MIPSSQLCEKIDTKLAEGVDQVNQHPILCQQVSLTSKEVHNAEFNVFVGGRMPKVFTAVRRDDFAPAGGCGVESVGEHRRFPDDLTIGKSAQPGQLMILFEFV